MGPNWKIRVARAALEKLGIDGNAVLRHGIEREVYAVPLATNWQEILLGGQKNVRSCVLPASEIADFCLRRWIEARADERLSAPQKSCTSFGEASASVAVTTSESVYRVPGEGKSAYYRPGHADGDCWAALSGEMADVPLVASVQSEAMRPVNRISWFGSKSASANSTRRQREARSAIGCMRGPRYGRALRTSEESANGRRSLFHRLG